MTICRLVRGACNQAPGIQTRLADFSVRVMVPSLRAYPFSGLLFRYNAVMSCRVVVLVLGRAVSMALTSLVLGE